MEPEGSLPCSQAPVTVSNGSSPHPHTALLKVQF